MLLFFYAELATCVTLGHVLARQFEQFSFSRYKMAIDGSIVVISSAGLELSSSSKRQKKPKVNRLKMKWTRKQKRAKKLV